MSANGSKNCGAPFRNMHLCCNCFRERPDFQENPEQKGPCPYCGFDLSENQAAYPKALRAGTILNNRYLVGRVLGQGGFGITYVAWDQKLSARVAVKEYMPGEMAARLEGTTVYVMAAERTEDFAYGEERFKEEARTLAKFMGQPNIAGVTDYFDENQTSYFVMDYIEGISFKTYIANAGGRVSPKEALNVMIPVLRALTAVHGEGFIHRDVTPDNIYITKDGNVKLLDFGSARYSLGDKSKSLDVILKVGYAPKEQYIRRGRQGPYTDVYSCAACLYAAITGYLPPEALERLDHDELVPPSQAGVELPLYLERAILKGLAVQPEDRFQTAAQFLETLESQTVAELPEACGAGLPGSQAAAGLPGGQAAADFAGKAGASASEDALRPGREAGKTRKSRRPLPLILGGAAAVILLFAAGSLFGGRGGLPGGGKAHLAGAGAQGGAAADGGAGSGPLVNGGASDSAGGAGGAVLAADTAPKVTIAGEAYSTALSELDLTGKNLTDADLINLSQMSGLTVLRLGENPAISDLTPLAGLTGLSELYLPSPSGITDLSPLAGLTGLTRLTFERDGEVQPNPELTDFSALAGLTGLTRLDLVVMNLEDLSFLSGLTKLRTLRLFGTVTAEDLTALQGLTKMQELLINDASGLKTAAGIEGMTEMRDLQIYNESGTFREEDLSRLAGMNDLQYLNYRVNGLASFHGLEGKTKLTEAVFNQDGRSDCTYTDLEPFRNLTSLTVLTLPMRSAECTSTYNADAISGLTSLTELRLDRGVESLEPVRNLTKLQSLNARSGHAVNIGYHDLEPLSGLTELRNLELMVGGSSEPVDLTPLSGLTKLDSLFISAQGIESAGPSVTNLSALSSLTELRTLELWARNLTDISPLSALTGLQSAVIQAYNTYGPAELTDVSALDHVPSLTVESSGNVIVSR